MAGKGLILSPTLLGLGTAFELLGGTLNWVGSLIGAASGPWAAMGLFAAFTAFVAADFWTSDSGKPYFDRIMDHVGDLLDNLIGPEGLVEKFKGFIHELGQLIGPEISAMVAMTIQSVNNLIKVVSLAFGFVSRIIEMVSIATGRAMEEYSETEARVRQRLRREYDVRGREPIPLTEVEIQALVQTERVRLAREREEEFWQPSEMYRYHTEAPPWWTRFFPTDIDWEDYYIREPPTAQLGAKITRGGLLRVHDEEVILNPKQQQQFGGNNITINMTVYGGLEDEPYTAGQQLGEGKMTSKIKAVFEWLDGSQITFKRFKSINYSMGVNVAGNFSAVLPANDDALSILMGSNFYVYKEDHRTFGGRTQYRTIDEAQNAITITGVDFTGLLGTRKCTYDTLGVLESSETIKTILQTFIRNPNDNLPLFNIDYNKYIIKTATEKRWNFTRASVLDCCVRVANISTSNAGRIGFIFYVDPQLFVHFEPLGSGEIKDILPLSNVKFGEDHRDIKNLVEYWGGKEITYPVIPDSWTDLGNAADWTVEICSAGCQTICQTGCESPNPCQTCGETENLQGTCDLACQGDCVSACQDTCETACQFACQSTCQICYDGGTLVGI